MPFKAPQEGAEQPIDAASARVVESVSRPSLPPDLLHSTKYPWSLIQLDYCAGVIPVAGICHKYGISPERLQTIARREQWVRRVITSEDLYGPKMFGVHFHPPGSVPVTLDDVQRHAREQAVLVIDSHKKSLARARQVYETLMNRMLLALNGTPELLRDEQGDYVRGEPTEQFPLGEPQFAPWTGNRESPADVLGKLSASLVRFIGLERQAYGLDVLSINDPAADADTRDSAIKAELSALEDKLNSIAAGKAEPPPPRVEQEEN